MATNNSINRRSGNLTVDPGASGDSWIQFDVNGANKFRMGVDDTDSDKFKISYGSALGTNDYLVMTSNGEMTLPKQSSCLAYLSSPVLNVTGDNTAYWIVCDTEVWDLNSDYDHTTGIFTAPLKGGYFVYCNVYAQGLLAAHTARFPRIWPIGGSNIVAIGGSNLTGGTMTGSCSWNATNYIKMGAGDTIQPYVRVAGSTKTVDLYGEAVNLYTSFGVTLMYSLATPF